MHFYPDTASTLCFPTFCLHSALFTILPLIINGFWRVDNFQAVCTACAHNAPAGHARFHKTGVCKVTAFTPCAANFRATGDRKPCHGRQKRQYIRLFLLPPMTGFLTQVSDLSKAGCPPLLNRNFKFLQHVTVFTRSATGVAWLWLTRALQPYTPFLHTVQTSVDKCADKFRYYLHYITP